MCEVFGGGETRYLASVGYCWSQSAYDCVRSCVFWAKGVYGDLAHHIEWHPWPAVCLVEGGWRLLVSLIIFKFILGTLVFPTTTTTTIIKLYLKFYCFIQTPKK